MSLGLNLDKIRNYLDTNQNAGQIVLQKTRVGNAVNLKEAGVLHKIKSFFGFAKKDNEATINEIRSAIQNDRKLYAVAGDADSLFAQVKGTITTQKLRSILDTLDGRVSSLGTDAYKEKAQAAIAGHLAGRLATRPLPDFLGQHSTGSDFAGRNDFKTWYAKTVAAQVFIKSSDGKQLNEKASLSTACDKGIREFNDCFRKYINELKTGSTFADKVEARRIETFAKMCMDGKVLVTNSDGSLNDDKTMANVSRLKQLFRLKETMKEGEKFMAWYNDAADKYGRQAQAPGGGEDSFDGYTEFSKFFGQCLNIFDGNRSRIETFAKMCMDEKMLVTTQNGAIDQEKTLEKVQQLNERLKLTETMNNIAETMNKLKEKIEGGEKFMAWYNAAAVKYGKQAQAPGSGKDSFDGRTEFAQFFDKCLKHFDGQRRIEAFAKMCMAGKILVTTPKGDLDLDKTMKNVERLKSQLNLADKIGSNVTHSVKTLVMMNKWNLNDDPDFIAWYNLASAVYVHSNLGQEKSINDLCREFDEFFADCLESLDGNINTFFSMCKDGDILATTPDLDFDKNKTMENVQRFAQQPVKNADQII